MLSCGKTWQPTEIDRVVEYYRTSTRVAKIRTDAGIGFLKGMGNPAGNESLASELVGSELATLLGLVVPPFAILDVQDIEIPRADWRPVDLGPAFISKEIPALTADGTDTFLKKVVDRGDLARLIVLDTWIRNVDRCPPPDYMDPEPRRDNLLFTPIGNKFQLVALDHTHCFVEEDLESGLTGPQFVDDTGVYGFFPEFVPYVSDAAVQTAVAALRKIDADAVAEIVQSVPAPWGPPEAVRRTWCERIVARRDAVAAYVSNEVVRQRELGFGE